MSDRHLSEQAFAEVIGTRRGGRDTAFPRRASSRVHVVRGIRVLVEEALTPGSDLLDVVQRLQAAASGHGLDVRPGVFSASDGSGVRLALTAVIADERELIGIIEADPDSATARLLHLDRMTSS